MSRRTLQAMLLVGLGVGLMSVPLAAQDTTRMAGIGTRVRLGFADKGMDPVIGEVVDLGPDSITVAPGRGKSVSLPRTMVQTVQVSIERKTNRVRGAAIGAGVGAGIAGVAILFAALVVGPCDDGTSGNFLQWESCYDATAGEVAGGILKASLVGGAVGALLSRPRDRWADAHLDGDLGAQESPLSPQLLLGFDRAVRVGIRMRF